MQRLFPGFYYSYPQGEERSKLWKEAIFVFDANMLLNVYRYSSPALSRYFEILGRLQERQQVWLPYQVVSEYQENREIVINARAKAYDDVSAVFDKASRDFGKLLGSDKDKHFMNPEELTKKILEEIEKSKSQLNLHAKENKKDIYRLLTQDSLREKLETIFSDNIGKPYSWDELQKMYEMLDMRFKLGIPPGLEDQESKDNYKKYGDAIVWFQLIDYARSRREALIFVTDDGKPDWWRIDDRNKKPVGPRTELVQEMFIEANTTLYMYNGSAFLEIATEVFDFEEKPEAIEDAKGVSRQNEWDAKQKNVRVYQEGIDFVVLDSQVERAVRRWLEDKYPYPQFQIYVPSHSDSGADLVVVGLNFVSHPNAAIGRIEVIIKSGVSPRNFLSSDGVIQQTIEKCGAMDPLRSIMLFLLVMDENLAQNLSQFIEDASLSIPQNLSIIVGFVQDGNLLVVSTFPRQRG